MSTAFLESRPLTFAVIGDSAAFGTGDCAPDGTMRGWAYYLANSFKDQTNYLNFSRPGAKSGEVSQVQLSKAIDHAPDICAVIAGGNDLLRNGFDPKELYLNLRKACDELMSRGSEVIMVELHDPNALLRIPKLLKRVLRRRVEAVNDVYATIAEELDVLLIRTREIPNVHDLRNWHIDRMHPGPKGHQLLANEMVQKLRSRGWELQDPEISETEKSSKIAQFKWLLANGLPWFLKRSVDLLPAAIFLMTLEALKILFSIPQSLISTYSPVTEK